MALRTRTFRDTNELRDLLQDNEMGTEDFKYLGQNNSGHLEILFDDAEEIFSQAAGTTGTVTLGDGERLHTVWCMGASGATVEIFGGTAIPVPAGAGSFFSHNFKGKLKGDAVKTIVFTSTTSYFVTSIDRS